MPELPEVEILVRHLSPLIKGKTIRQVEVHRTKVIAPTSGRVLEKTLAGARFLEVNRRGKYLLFTLRKPGVRTPLLLLGHLGMTGRMYLLRSKAPLPRHAAVSMDLGRCRFIYEDTRYFGRLTLDTNSIAALGPEPLGPEFTVAYLTSALKRSAQPVKVKLMDQALVAGVGNIYASEALFRAGISPRLAANKLKTAQIKRLRQAIRDVLRKAIKCGSTLPLDFEGSRRRDGLFYYGSAGNASAFYQERLLVYDRHGKPCARCRTGIIRLVQAARSTFYCPRCQPE
jgi:formamidopyrimidine-DNA glycosylase